MSEAPVGIESPKRYQPDYKLESAEVATEANNFYAAFKDLLDNDPQVQEAIAGSEHDSALPAKKTSFRKGSTTYRISLTELRNDAGVEYGKRLYLFRYDKMKNEEELTVDIGEKPSVDYKSIYAGGVDKPPEYLPPSKSSDRDLRPVVVSTGYKIDRDYVANIGLAINGTNEMLERMRKDFNKPIPTF